jgi:hypothetical protein
MRTIIYAAIAAASVAGISSAIADEGDGAIANTQFTQLPSVIAQVSTPSARPVALVREAPGAAAFVTETTPGVWLLRQYDNGGDNR